jgi:oligoendopeptidase F
MIVRRVRLLALLLAAVLLLSGCSFLTADRDAYVSMVPFDEMRYVRPDLDAALAEADDLIASLERGMKLRRATDALDQLFTEYYHMRTMEALSTIRSDSDVTDPFYSAEYAFCSDAVIAFRGKMEEVFAACAASDLKDGLDDYFGEGFLDDYGEDYVYPERLYELQRQENDLVTQYYSALVAQRLTIQGKEYTLDDLLLADRDGTLPDVTIEQAVDQYYDQANAALGSIFVELVKVRHALAAEAGYDRFLDMAYDQNDRDFTPDAAARFTEAVQREIVPLYREAKARGLEDEAFYGTPETDTRDSLMTVMDIASSMGGDVGDTADFILEYDLVNAEVSDKKVSDSYEIYISDYESPYILASTIGYAEDILTIAHELGHAVDDFVHYEAADSTDVSETLSQGMEYLTLFYLQEDDVYDSLLAYKLMDVLRLYAEQGSYNAFEERVYALDEADLTLENINAIALDCARSFGLESEWGDGYDSRSWVEITHFFQQPLYIVSYIASDSLAIQFYQQELAEEGQGLKLYEKAMDLAGDTEFMDLAKELGLRDPLSEEQVKATAELMREQLLNE